MPNVPRTSGLSLRAAIVRYGNPRLLLDYPGYVRAHRASGGSGRIRISLPEEIYGDEAVVLNRRSAIARQARVERDNAWKRILRDLSAKLVDGRLVAYGSLDSSLNPSAVLGAAAWKHLRLKDLRASTLLERTKPHHRVVYSVGIFPTLEAQCAADRLIGQLMIAIIKQHVLNDPEIVALIYRMNEEGVLSPQFLRRVPVGSFENSDMEPFDRISVHRKIRRYQIRCAAALRRRLHSLNALLRSGKLIVQGLSPHTSALSRLPPEFWSQPYVYVDLGSSEIYYRAQYDLEPVPILRLPNFQPEAIGLSLPLAPLPSKKAPKRTPAKASAASDCKNWLVQEMRASVNTRPQPKAVYSSDALARWGHKLSKEAFDRAWAAAVEETGANWDKGGRPRKSTG